MIVCSTSGHTVIRAGAAAGYSLTSFCHERHRAWLNSRSMSIRSLRHLLIGAILAAAPAAALPTRSSPLAVASDGQVFVVNPDSSSVARLDFSSPPALYFIGYFEVEAAGLATSFSSSQLKNFAKNFHVMHAKLFRQQRSDLVLVKGGEGSRLYRKAHLLSTTTRLTGKPPLKILSPAMRQIFGHFGGHFSFQRSPTRWVEPAFVPRAAAYVRSLP